MAIESAGERPPIPALTGLRFWAAFIIVYSHTINAAGGSVAQTWQIASAGMSLFFVLSGFVIHYNYADVIAGYGASGRRKFIVARIARLYPLYLLFLVSDIAIHSNQGSEHTLLYLPLFLTLTQNWFPIFTPDGQISGLHLFAAWSISAEVMMYLLYIPLAPLLLRLGHRATFATFCSLALASLAVLAIAIRIIPDDNWSIYSGPYCRLPEFFLGALVAQLAMTGMVNKRFSRYLPWVSGAAVTFAACLFAAQMFEAGNWPGHFAWGYAVPAAAITAHLALVPSSTAGRILGSWFLVVLGDASYSLYFLHGWILAWYPDSSDTPLAFLLQAGTAWLLSILLSVGLYRVYEVPARAWIRKTFSPNLTLFRSATPEAAPAE
jgi:peptidoglycan/LPS O-acetylase OafA/YrhL